MLARRKCRFYELLAQGVFVRPQRLRVKVRAQGRHRHRDEPTSSRDFIDIVQQFVVGVKLILLDLAAQTRLHALSFGHLNAVFVGKSRLHRVAAAPAQLVLRHASEDFVESRADKCLFFGTQSDFRAQKPASCESRRDTKVSGVSLLLARSSWLNEKPSFAPSRTAHALKNTATASSATQKYIIKSLEFFTFVL